MDDEGKKSPEMKTGKTIMNGKSKRIWKEAAVEWFKKTSRWRGYE